MSGKLTRRLSSSQSPPTRRPSTSSRAQRPSSPYKTLDEEPTMPSTTPSGSAVTPLPQSSSPSAPNAPASASSVSLSTLSALLVAAMLATMWAVMDLSSVEWSEASLSRKVSAVWWYGWITAASTGLGALPFVFASDLPETALGMCNALAAGMMSSASVSLLLESSHNVPTASDDGVGVDSDAAVPWLHVGAGLVVGLAFVHMSQAWLDQHEHLKFAGLSGITARKMLLVVGVMTIHSFSEGVGIGVSFAGKHGGVFGLFITGTLALHNIPEGLAICLALVPHKIHVLEAGLWAVFTSLPQPLMAVPAFLFTKHVVWMLPAGLAFAAGAMGYVAVFDLLAEAREQIGRPASLGIALVSGVLFSALTMLLKHDVGSE